MCFLMPTLIAVLVLSLPIEVVMDREGVVTHLLIRTSEGDSKAVRLADPK
jgi:hypothetical protein